MKKIITIIIIIILGGIALYIYKKPKYKENINQEEKNKTYKYAILCYKNNSNIVILNSDETFEEIPLTKEINKNITQGQAITITYNNNEISKIEKLNQNETEYQKLFNNEGIFKQYNLLAFKKMQEMSLDEKIGQLFFVRIPEQNQIKAIKDYNLGGYILFGRDTQNETKKSLTDKIKNYQNNAKIPMLIATDEEGGTVVRVSKNPNLRNTPFKSPQQIYKNGGFEAIKENVKEMSTLLSELGINVNFAPVADISNNPNDFIYNRAIGLDTTQTSEYIKNVITESKNYNVSYTMKHFPGYGNNDDTHTGIAIDNRTIESIKQNDLLPFKSGIESQGEAIMVSHNIIKSLDNEKPASLSYKVHNLARKNLKFNGILMTDDLDMQAITKYTNSPYIDAFLSGNDMILLSNYQEAHETIKNAIENNILSEDIINHATTKVLAWKYYKGLLKQ